jgi:signal transduction histidine kinase
MKSLGSQYRLETWRQGAPVRVTIAQVIIIAALTPTALSGRWGSAWVNLALCLAAAVWGLIVLHPGLRKRPPVMAVFVTGVVAISIVLVIRDPWAGFYAYAGYSYSILLLRWPWQLAGVAGTAVVAATAQSAGVDRTTPGGMVAFAAILAANAIAVSGITWFLHRVETQHEERGKMLDELRGSNQRLEAALAENAGLHQQLLTQAREAGILDERQRMAREIHDTLAQGLTGIITQLQAAEHAAGEPAAWRKHFAAATKLARDSLTEARRSVNALRPEPLENASLSGALADTAANWSALSGIPVQVTTTGTERPLRPEAEVALLRTAQEGLANVAKHAQASRVGVTLSYMEHEVALDVRDDGRGFDGLDSVNGGVGLIAMRQRIEGLAGTLQIESEPGAGTGISACIPTAATGVAS